MVELENVLVKLYEFLYFWSIYAVLNEEWLGTFFAGVAEHYDM